MTCPSILCRRPAAADLLGGLAARVRAQDTVGQFARFVLVGASTTLVYAALFAAFGRLGYLPAHLLSTTASTALANELHRRLTFRAEDRVRWFTAQWEAGGVTVLGMLATSAALGWLDALTQEATLLAQVTVVVSVTGMVGLMRFVALRWLFHAQVPLRTGHATRATAVH